MTMNLRKISGALIPVSLAAFALAGWRFAQESSTDFAPTAIDSPSLVAMSDRVAQLHAEMRRLREQLMDVSEIVTKHRDSQAPATLASDSIDRMEALSDRISALGERIESLAARGDRGKAKPEALDIPETVEPGRMAEALAAWQNRVLDTTKSAEERVSALGMLRSYPDGIGARTSEVIGSALQLMDSSRSAEVRRDICRHLKGCKDPRVSGTLSRRLAGDPSEEVRIEAAESLSGFHDDPAVIAALTHAQNHDASPRVRAEAAQALR